VALAVYARSKARILEGAAKAHVAAVHHVDDGRDHLVIRAGVLRTRAHEIEERDVRDGMRP